MEKEPLSSLQLLKLFLLVLMHTLCYYAYGENPSSVDDGSQIIQLQTERLPDLNINRAGHITLCLDGELTVFGGHTDAFVPTATAEYLRDGVWHTIPLAYTHDQGTVLELSSGKVFLAGGHQQPLGIGQLFSAEIYDPKTHTCNGFGSMQKKRVFANAVELTDGQVAISGVWYADDGIEMFDNLEDSTNIVAKELKPTSLARATPYMLRIADDDAIIFSSIDSHGDSLDSSVVDRIKGPAYHESFLAIWRPLPTIYIQRSLNQFVGDEAEGRYEWLLPVVNDGVVAIAHVKGHADGDSIPTFSLLPTAEPIPLEIDGKQIIYSSLIADRERGNAYLIGNDDTLRIVVISFSYDTDEPNPLTIYLTAPQPFAACNTTPALTPEGDLIFAGGFINNNFYPTNAVVRLTLGSQSITATDVSSITAANHNGHWMWIFCSFLMACGIVAMLYISHNRHKSGQDIQSANLTLIPTTADVETESKVLDKNMIKEETLIDLFRRIEQLMDNDKLYLDPNLKASDVAERVGSNISYVSGAINSQRGCSFTQFVNSYRIAYAQSLMRQSPERKLYEISTLSGFSNDSTFFRAFNAVTGLSPKKWLAKMHDQE